MSISQYFRLIDVQARMLLKADASRLTLGYLWWFIEPLLWVAMFYLVFNVLMHSQRGGGESLVFLATGKLAFIWFSKTVVQASNSIVAGQGLVGRINVPKSMFPIAATHESIYRQSAVYLLLLAILLVFGFHPSWNWLWLLPLMVVYYLMIVACALVGAFLVCLMRDFTKAIPLAMTFLMFTSGIFWDVRNMGSPETVDLFFTVNPLAFILDAHRQILMHGNAPELGFMVGIAVGATLMIAVMIHLMRRYSQYLALRVLS